MVLQWKITRNDGLNLIHNTIISVLRKSNDQKMDLNELIIKINQQSKMNQIHNLKKYNLLSKYIKSEYGGIVKFLDSYSIYGVSNHNHKTMAHLLNDRIDDYTLIPKRITADEEWILI